MKIFFTLLFTATMAFSAKATLHIVTCQNGASHFLPITLDALVGDTVRWVWVSGIHIVGPILPTDLPAGAPLFNASINSTNTSYQYELAVEGFYHYVCHPGTPHEEDAYISVTTATGLETANGIDHHFSIYPNPSNGKFQLAVDDVMVNENYKIEISDAQGQVIYHSSILNVRHEIELLHEPSGVYFITVFNAETVVVKRIVKA